MAKKKQSTAARKVGRPRGGRRPGSWTLLTPEALRSWRENHKMSRGNVATALGVSATSVQNWETGYAVATAKMQERLVELMKSAVPAAKPAVTSIAATPNRTPNGVVGVNLATSDSALIQATASIVVEAIRAGARKNVTAKEIGLLVRTVRDALV